MADTYVISTVFKANDQMSSTVGAVTGKMNQFGKQSARSFKRATAGATKFKTVFSGVLGAGLVSRGLAKIQQGVSGLVDEFLDLDHAVTSASAKFGFERGTEQFKALEKSAREVAAVTPFSAAKAAKGLDFLAMAGFSAEQSMSSLKGITDLATAGDMDLAQAADIASDALGALGLMTDDTAELAVNLDRVKDVLAETAVSANTDIPMLWEALKPAASVARGLGGSVEELGALFGTLAAEGTKAEKAGTALRNMYLRLTSGTAEVDKVLTKYKINIADSKGEMRPMIDILGDVTKKMEGVDQITKRAALTHLFGTKAVGSAIILLDKGSVALNKYRDRLKGANGASKEMARVMGGSFQNRLAAVKSRFIEIGLSVADTFTEKIPGAMDSFQQSLDAVNPSEIIQGIKDFGSAIESLTVVLGLYVIGTQSYIAWTKIQILWTNRAKVAQWALNAAMTANPVGAIVLALAVLGAGIWKMYRNWDAVKNLWKKDIVAIGNWIDDYLVQPISKFLGLATKSDAQINKLSASQAAASAPGYILGANQPGVAAGKDLAAQIKTENAAKPQQVQINGEFNFKNPPAGMSFEQDTEGTPPIKHNLGQN